MRSRAAKLTLGAAAIILVGAAAVFTFSSEQQIIARQATLRTFDGEAREATDAFADLRVAQEAYVAAGQGIAFWVPKVAGTADAAAKSVASLRQLAASRTAQAALDDAAATITGFGAVDKRARDYLSSDQALMAADVIFTEGNETAATASRQVEAGRLAEHQSLDALEAGVRRQEAAALAGAAGIAVLVILILAFARSAPRTDEEPVAVSAPPGQAQGLRVDPTMSPSVRNSGLSLRDATPAAAPSPPRVVSPLLTAAAALCTDFGRVREVSELRGLLARASQVMEASGLVVWMGNTSGADLRPVLAHGYSDQTLTRMPAVPRSGDNAAAAAYRTGALQIVLSQPGGSTGAVVAPLLSADGCIGALSVEIKGGGEVSDGVQALAAIFAAQLAGVLAVPAADAAPTEARAAAQA
jgi:hypothetical protein